MNKNTKMAANLFMLAAGMVMLAYASVPLYRLFCEVTGYGGTIRQAKIAPAEISEREIVIKFNADIAPDLRWEFKAGEHEHKVKVGQQALTYYVAHNLENKPVKGRAIYNVLPFKAGSYFNKIECFCFTEQTLQAGQRVDMPVSFFLDPKMLDDPEMDDVRTITLSYTFFPAAD